MFLALRNGEKSSGENDISKSEENQQFSRSLSADDTDAAFRERLKNMGKCNYVFYHFFRVFYFD